jgi:hypothetical protein
LVAAEVVLDIDAVATAPSYPTATKKLPLADLVRNPSEVEVPAAVRRLFKPETVVGSGID